MTSPENKKVKNITIKLNTNNINIFFFFFFCLKLRSKLDIKSYIFKTHASLDSQCNTPHIPPALSQYFSTTHLPPLSHYITRALPLTPTSFPVRTSFIVSTLFLCTYVYIHDLPKRRAHGLTWENKKINK